MCKKKTSNTRRIKARIKVGTDEIIETIRRHADNLEIRGKIEEIKGELELS